jgi:hypothetical protein
MPIARRELCPLLPPTYPGERCLCVMGKRVTLFASRYVVNGETNPCHHSRMQSSNSVGMRVSAPLNALTR